VVLRNGRAFGAKTGLACLGQIENKAQKAYQPAWVTRATLLSMFDRTDEAVDAYITCNLLNYRDFCESIFT